MSEMRAFGSVEDFLFEAPLYEKVTKPATEEELASITKQPIDGFCPYCGTLSMFSRRGKLLIPAEWQQQRGSFEISLTCARNEKHKLFFQVFIHKGGLEKIGQYPSYATVAQGYIKSHRKLLTKQDSEELTKAIGLAAHDAAIGAFTYVRRIFERLIRKCFDDNKSAEGWTEEQYKVRMEDRILLMKNHLPEFVVESRKLYGILSSGVHELTEEQCSSFFPVARESVLLILSENQRKKDEKTRKSALQAAIAHYEPAAPAARTP